MKSSGIAVRENDSLQGEEMQNFHECQRFLGKLFTAGLSKYSLLSES